MASTIAYAPTGEGLSIAYRAIGHGPLTILLVPALIAHVELLSEEPSIVGMVMRLTSELRLVTYDRRGTGPSDRADSATDLTLERVGHDIMAVLDHAEVDKAILLAWSWGGPTAIRFAADHPDRTAGLVLLSSLARNMAGDGYEMGRPEEDLNQLAANLAVDWGSAAFANHMPSSMSGNSAFVDWAAKVARHSLPPGEVTGVALALGQHDARADLPQVRAPTLVIHWGNDRFIEVGHSHYLADRIRAAELHELKGPGRLSLAEQSEAVSLVLDFARRLAPPDRRRPVSARPSISGWAELTAAEREVAHLVATGMSNKQIAVARCVSPYTVDAHLRRIFHKMRVANRTELTRRMLSERLTQPHSSHRAWPPLRARCEASGAVPERAPGAPGTPKTLPCRPQPSRAGLSDGVCNRA
jgi:pimeloyl-ACP methyl ester carboxylesterase